MPRLLKCLVCETDLPATARQDLRYCGVTCRVRAHRTRKTVPVMKPPRPRARPRSVNPGTPRTRLDALRAADALTLRIAGLEERRTELGRKLQWAAAESNQRVLTVTQELTAAHNAVLDQLRKEAAEREQHIQETLLSDSKVAIEAVRVEAAKQRQEMAAQVAQLQKDLRQTSTDLSGSRDRADRAEAALLSEREQRQSLAASLTEQRSQVTRLQTAMSNPTPAETQLGKELAAAHENQRQSNQALSAARSAAERIDAALRDERQRRERLTTQVAELQAQLATRQKAKPDPTEKELELQKELEGAERKLQTANQTKEDIEKPWRQRVQELEQQLRSATEEQKKLQAQAVAARPQAQTRASDMYRALEQEEQEESDRQGLKDLLKDKIRLLDQLAYLQESLHLPITGTRLRDSSAVMVSAKATVLAKEVRLAYYLRSQRHSEPPATWRQQAELMDHDSEHELWVEQASEVQRLRSEAAALESRKKLGRR